MTESRVQILRFWLLAGLLFCLAPWRLDLALWLLGGLVPVGLFMPVFPAATNNCSSCCSATGTSISISLAGVANASCISCTSYNTGVVTTFLFCNNTAVTADLGCGFTLSMTAFIACNGNTTVQLQADGNPLGGQVTTTGQSIGTKPADCSSWSVSPSTASTNNGSFGLCDFSAGTMSAVAS